MIMKLFLGVAQLVARYLGVVEAGCSSHLTQTSGVAPAGLPCTAPSDEGALRLYKILTSAWSPGFIFTYRCNGVAPAGMPCKALGLFSKPRASAFVGTYLLLGQVF